MKRTALLLLFISGIIYGRILKHLDLQQAQTIVEVRRIDRQEKTPLLSAEVVVSEKERKKVEVFFEKHLSPLAEHSGIFVWVSSRYNLPYSLLPAIACVESSCGKYLPKFSFNPFGWDHARTHFDSYIHSIIFVGKQIAEAPQYHRFQATGRIEDLSAVYAEDSRHAEKVKKFMNEIEK